MPDGGRIGQRSAARTPPAKGQRGNPSLRIGDPGPMGRLLISGEPGADIIPALAPQPGEPVIDKPGKGMFWSTGVHETLQARGITHLVFTGVTSWSGRAKRTGKPFVSEWAMTFTMKAEGHVVPRLRRYLRGGSGFQRLIHAACSPA